MISQGVSTARLWLCTANRLVTHLRLGSLQGRRKDHERGTLQCAQRCQWSDVVSCVSEQALTDGEEPQQHRRQSKDERLPKKIHVQKSVHVCMVCYNVCVIDADSGLWGFVRTVIDMMMQFVFVGAIISPQPPSISSSSLSGILA